MNLLDPEELSQVLPAETHSYPSPVPTQSVSSDEFMPATADLAQRRVEARMKELGGELARQQGMTAALLPDARPGMAAAFLAMNEVYGSLYEVSRAEAQTPEMAKERAKALSKQFVMDCHTHFLRDDTRIMVFVRAREGRRQGGLEPGAGRQATDHRGSEVRQLLQGDLPRQRHQGGHDLRARRRTSPRTGS